VKNEGKKLKKKKEKEKGTLKSLKDSQPTKNRLGESIRSKRNGRNPTFNFIP